MLREGVEGVGRQPCHSPHRGRRPPGLLTSWTLGPCCPYGLHTRPLQGQLTACLTTPYVRKPAPNHTVPYVRKPVSHTQWLTFKFHQLSCAHLSAASAIMHTSSRQVEAGGSTPSSTLGAGGGHGGNKILVTRGQGAGGRGIRGPDPAHRWAAPAVGGCALAEAAAARCLLQYITCMCFPPHGPRFKDTDHTSPRRILCKYQPAGVSSTALPFLYAVHPSRSPLPADAPSPPTVRCSTNGGSSTKPY